MEDVAAQAAIAPTDTLSTPGVVRVSGANTDASTAMLRTLVGMEDFARTNAHYGRWGSHPTLSHSPCGRMRLYCLLNTTESVLIRNGTHVWIVFSMSSLAADSFLQICKHPSSALFVARISKGMAHV